MSLERPVERDHHPSGGEATRAQQATARWPAGSGSCRSGWDAIPSQIMGTKAERQAARERVNAYHQAELAGLLTHVVAAVDGYRAGKIDTLALDETIHHYHRAAGELWKFCFAGGGGSHAEFLAGVLDRMAAGAETIDWWERATPRQRQ